MKTISKRSDIVVLGAGLAGISAALCAARAGSTVTLLEARPFLGGRIGKEIKFLYDFTGTTNFAYQRETGLLDEILTSIFVENEEGNYVGQDRALSNLILNQERLNIFLETQLFEVKKNVAEDKIESITAICRKSGDKILFRARFFLDCSNSGELCQLAQVPGEFGIDQLEYEKTSAQTIPERFRATASMQIEISEKEASFICPSWVTLRWEENNQSAQIELLESLNRGIEGVHNVEWLGKANNVQKLESAQLIWSAWDYLKNRSPISDKAKKWVVHDFSPLAINSHAFRAEGAYTLTPEDMETGNCFYDSVALGRAPLDVASSLLSSSRGKIALAQPFEIPLRTLYSKKIKNLLFAGEHASSTSRASASFSHPPTSAQMGEAVGACAALCVKKNRLPRTISKPGNVEELRRNLNRLNHTCSLSEVEDSDNLIFESKVVASTTTRKFVNISPSLDSPFCPVTRGLIQFPVTSKIIDEVMIFVEVAEDCKIELRLLENSSKISTIPGNCLNVIAVDLIKGGPRWEKIAINAKVKNVGWHFLEFNFGGKVTFFLQENACTGTLLYKFANHQSGGLLNPYSEFIPCLPIIPSVPSFPAFDVLPNQAVFEAENVSNGGTRPNFLPNLWISEETDFKYPEYLEFHWKEPVDISTIEIIWDATLEYLFPARPQPIKSPILPSVVKEYKLYFMNDVGHWEELLAVFDNSLGFSSHSFETIKTNAIEIEISKTHGLNRAQVYQVRAYH